MHCRFEHHQKLLKMTKLLIPSVRQNFSVTPPEIHSSGSDSLNIGGSTVIKKEYVKITALPLIQTSHLTSP